MKKLLITSCNDPLRWYSNMMHNLVPYLGDVGTEYKSREPAGYINFVQYCDADIVEFGVDMFIDFEKHKGKKMKNKELKLLVKEAIKVYMQNDMAFTSVDICNYIRTNNKTKDVRMYIISKFVRKYVLNLSTYLNSNYQATFINVDTESNVRLAYLYHHMDFDINNYLSRDQTTFKTK